MFCSGPVLAPRVGAGLGGAVEDVGQGAVRSRSRGARCRAETEPSSELRVWVLAMARRRVGDGVLCLGTCFAFNPATPSLRM